MTYIVRLFRCLPVFPVLFAAAALPQPAQAQTQAQACAAAPAGIVTWLSADGISRNLVGGGIDGTPMNGAGFSAGRAGPGFGFDGVDDFVRLPNEFFDFYAQPAYSIELWFRTTGGGVILGEQTVEALDPSIAFSVPGIYVGTDGLLRVETFWAGGIQQLTSPATVNDGQWQHVASTYDGQSRRAYLNGTLIGQSSAGRSRYAGNLRYQLGTGVGFNRTGLPNTPFYSYRGDIDEFTVYSRALSQEEIIAIVNAGASGKCLAPLPYLQRGDSPFLAGLQAGSVQLQDVEDGQIGLPGVILSSGQAQSPTGITDSVDGDDGAVDGSGAGGNSIFSCSLPVTATFSAPLPTAAGVVWTDGAGLTTFQAFDGAGNRIADVSASHADPGFNATTAEDRFFGLRNPQGIGSILINTQNNCIELDHLQFGRLASGVISGFDTDAEGWLSVDIPLTAHNPAPQTGGVQYEAALGNPGGAIRLFDQFNLTGAAAPAAYLGNRASFFGGELRYDIQVLAVDGAGDRFNDGRLFAEVVLNGGSFSLHRIPTLGPAAGVFVNRRVPLSTGDGGWRVNGPGGAVATDADMQAVLASLQGLYIQTEYVTGNDDTRLDNVQLLAPVADTTPDPFSFASRLNVRQNRVQLSDAIRVAGLSGSAPISVSGGTYSLNGALATGQPGTVSNGDRVTLRQRSSLEPLTSVTTTLSIGGVSASFTTTTRAADSVPDAYAFASRSNAALGSVQRSTAVRIRGIDTPAPISVTGGSYSINGRAYTTAAGTVRADELVSLSHTAAGTPATQTVTTLNIDGIRGSFTSITVPADTQPDAFGFSSQSNVPVSTLRESNSLRIGGINAPAPISVSGGSYRINGGSYTSAAGSVRNGDTVQLRLTSAATAGSRVTATLLIGGVSGAFSVTTAGSPP